MKRTTKRKLARAIQYVVLLAVVVFVLQALDWPAVRKNFLDEGGLELIGTMVTVGVVNTLKYTVLAFAGGLALAVVLALMKLSSVRLNRWLATIYIEFFRGLPALVVIILVGLGVPIAFGWKPPGGLIGAGVLALVLVSAAYIAETLRAGIQAVPKGQTEAARSLGMSPLRTTFTIVLPQAFRIVIPPLTNEFVLLVKDTSLLFVLGMAAGQRELTTMSREFMTSGPTAGTSTSLIVASLLYLAITLPLTQLVAYMEKRQAVSR